MINKQTEILQKRQLTRNFKLFILTSLLLSIILPKSAFALDDSAPLIDQIIIRGNKYFSEDKIKDQMSLERNRWYNFLKKKRFYGWKLRQDQITIENYYRTHGFLDASAKLTHLIQDKKGAMVFVEIYEGIQTKLQSVRAKGGQEQFKRRTQKLINTLKVGSPLNPAKLNVVAFDIKTIYANKGHPYAEIKTLITKTKDKTFAEVVFEIDPKEEARFGEISFKGLKRTRKEVAQRELTIKEGELYSRAKIIDSQQRAYRSGLSVMSVWKQKILKRDPKDQILF